MAKELPVGRSFRRLQLGRFASTVYGQIKSVLDTVVPVQLVGSHDFSDNERPAFCISTFTDHPGPALRYCTASITSATDIAIEGFGWEQVSKATGLHSTSPIVVLTPPATYVPFQAGATYWFPGIIPSINPDGSYRYGRTVVVTGRTPNVAPYYGLELNANVAHDGAGIFFTAAQLTWYTFSPPLILPTPLYLTITTTQTNEYLWTSWRYREIS